MASIAAFFDLDRTLIKGASATAFADALADAGVTEQRSIPLADVFMKFYEEVGETPIAMLPASQAVRANKGWSVDKVATAAEAAAQVVAENLQPFATQVFDEHRAQGHKLVLATTSPEPLVAAIAEALDFDDYVCTRWASEGGEYTGEHDGPFVWGVEGGFGFSSLDIRDTNTLIGDVDVITDTFDISNLAPGGGPPPPPGTPSTGRSGTSALILVEPVSRSTTSYAGSTVSGYRDISGNLYDFRVGPFFEYQITKKFSAGLGAGLSFALFDGDYRFEETVTLPGAGSFPNSGSGSQVESMFGGYVGANLAYAFNQSWRVFGGAQYRNLGDYEQTVNGSTVEVDFSNTVQAIIGFGYSF